MNVGKTILYTEQLTKKYGSETILGNCNFAVKQGEIYGILGPNGAGKTTLLKLLAGFISPTAGKAVVKGIEVGANREVVQRYLGSLIETPVFYEELSGYKNLEIHLKYMDTAADIEETLRIVGLDAHNEKPVSKYSLGMRQRLAIARAFIHHPEVLVLDEPVNGLDPVGLMDMREVFRSLADAGVTIIISSHLLNELRQTADALLVVTDGRVIMEDTMVNLEKEHPEDLEKYLVDQMRGGAD